MKNRIKIFVDGKSFTLVGEETEIHMQAVASYIDEKISKIRKNAAAVKMDTSLAYVLTALNVADDYFKEKEKVAELEGRNLGLSARLEELVFQLDEAKAELAKLKESPIQENEQMDDAEKQPFELAEELEDKPEDNKVEELNQREETPNQREEKTHHFPMGLKGGQAERTMTQKAKKGKRRKK